MGILAKKTSELVTKKVAKLKKVMNWIKLKLKNLKIMITSLQYIVGILFLLAFYTLVACIFWAVKVLFPSKHSPYVIPKSEVDKLMELDEGDYIPYDCEAVN